MKSFLCAVLLLCAVPARAQYPEIHYEESAVPPYVLPDPLKFADGADVQDADAWRNQRRPEVLRLFEQHVYGRTPDVNVPVTFEVLSVEESALDGLATRKLVDIIVGEGAGAVRMSLLVYLPSAVERPVPLFLGLNFRGNHTVWMDPAVPLPTAWVGNVEELGIIENRALESSRGTRANRWPVARIIERGYGVATMYYGEIDPDFDDGFQNGIHPLFYKGGQTAPEPEEWGSIGAWAWGLSRAMDYLVSDADVDANRVVVMGHSRLGKTALWAGAQDERFAIVISNGSGCGGTALSRRRFGETVGRINRAFPHWFSDTFEAYNENEDALPIDQHMLLALLAPRPLYVASAEEDRWADPRGEFLALKAAEPVYRLLGAGGLPVDEMPPIEEPVIGTLGYHIRRGVHDVTAYDWERWMDFADNHWK